MFTASRLFGASTRQKNREELSHTSHPCLDHGRCVCMCVHVCAVCVCVSQRGLLLAVGSPRASPHNELGFEHFECNFLLLPKLCYKSAHLVALRATRPPVAGRNREAARGFTRFRDGARNAPLEASIAVQDAAKTAADDLMLITKSLAVDNLSGTFPLPSHFWGCADGARHQVGRFGVP